jgi:hypothetical protein
MSRTDGNPLFVARIHADAITVVINWMTTDGRAEITLRELEQLRAAYQRKADGKA